MAYYDPRKERNKIINTLETMLSNLNPDDRVSIVLTFRELANLLTVLSRELDGIYDIKAGLSRLEKNFIEYIKDNINYRIHRLEKETENEPYNNGNLLELEKARKMAKKLEEGYERMKSVEVTGKSHTFWDTWFAQKVLPTIVSTVLVVIILSVLQLAFAPK